MDYQTTRRIARAGRVRIFESWGYDAKAAAQYNLRGRTHYADDDTLRFFHSRILRARPEANGAVYLLVESCAADPDNRKRGFRFVVFDLFGTVVNDRTNATSDDMLPSSDKALRAAEAWIASFDVSAHYRTALADRAESLEREAADLRDCAASI